MVDILEASGANKPKIGLAAIPTSTISADEIARPGIEMGQALRGVGKAFDAFADKLDLASVPEAQAAGLAAVGRDANGEPTLEQRPFAISGADRAFNAAARQGFVSRWQTEAARGIQELAAKHPNDPAAFDAAAKTYIAGLGKSAKELRPLVLDEAQKLQQQHYLTIQNRAVALDRENARIAVTTQIEDNQNTLFALARKGGMSTPEVAEALARNRTLYEELGKNPAYGYPAARVKSEIERVQSQAIGESIVGEVDRTYDKRGKASAQKYLTDEILNNEKLSLSNSQRAAFYSSGLARLQYLDGETKAQVAAHRNVVSTIVTGLQSKVQIPDAQIDDALDTAQKLGDAESVLKLNAARSIASLRRGTGLTDEQEVKLFAGIGGVSGTPPASAPAGVDTIITNAAAKHGVSPRFMAKVAQIESRFDPNAFNEGSKATGLFQFIPSTWRQYGPGQNPRDPAANADAAARLTVANRNQLRASIGREPTEGELYLAHQQGAGGAASLLKEPNARAVDVVGERAVLGNGGTLDMTAGQFAMKWIRKFDGASAQVPAVTSPGAPFTPQQIAANPYLGSIWIHTQVADQKETIAAASRVADAISSGIDKGMLPDSQTFAAFLQMAEQFPDQLGRTRDQLVARARGHDDALIALGEPSTIGAQLVQDAMAKAQGAPILVQQRAEAMKEAFDRGAKALQERPWEEAARRGWANGPLPGLDFSSPAVLQAGLAARSDVATSITARTGQPQPVLSGADLSAVLGVWTNGLPGQREMVASQLASLPPEQFGLVMAETQMRDALIGMSRSGDPAKMSVAFSLMDAEQRRDPDGFGQRFGKDVENRLAAWMVRSQYMTSEDLAREAARYNDPAMQKARDQLRDDAYTKVKSLSPADVVGYFGTSWIPFTGPSVPAVGRQAVLLQNEFREEFAAAYAEVGDESKARELAVRRLGRVWAPSALNGGQLTKYAPELSPAYPSIDRSHAWLAKQLDDDVRAALGRTSDLGAPPDDKGFHPRTSPDPARRRERASDRLAMTEKQRAEVDRIDAMIAAPRMLVADARTGAEFTAGKPPTYPVVVQAPSGMYVPLQDQQGRPLRFVGDLDAAMAEHRQPALQRRALLESANADRAVVNARNARRWRHQVVTR
ncbi:transglycosylase SLT domain-containing protein [Bosea sp. 2RAB26]|uniref:transglycosylase SLT domain-containing protein n=1 Tax=Bosea sp. 2RAB26 TaxID=3237476 RepID=UPI003F91C0D9